MNSALKHLCVVLLAVSLLVVAGCGKKEVPAASSAEDQSSQPSTPQTNTAAANTDLPDPCTLLTKEEAESILGEPVKDPQPNSLGGNRICEFNSVKLHGGVSPYSIHIALTPETQKAWDVGKKMHTDAKEAKPVANLGDDAYFLLDDLDVRSQGLSIDIGVMKDIDKPSHAKSVQEAEKSVAEKILPRIKK